MTYIHKITKELLYKFQPEAAHNIAIKLLKNNLVPGFRVNEYKNLEQNLFGKKFKNSIGLAAGFDKNADCIANISKFGFGFVEVGTVTPKAQLGNPKPRLFRLEEDQSIINRLGFNNKGIEYFINNIAKIKNTDVIIGANIGKNKDTSNAIDDYNYLLEQLTSFEDKIDYITINISSPNTPGLRNLQNKEELSEFLKNIINKKNQLKTKLPLFLKIAPDLTEHELEDIAEICLYNKIDAIIISNTTSSRIGLKSAKKDETGGLSGKALYELSTEILKKMYKLTKGQITLIGVGGISTAEEAYGKIKQGASLVQLYSSFIYHGFPLIEKIKYDLHELVAKDGFSNIKEAIGVENK